MGIDGWWWKWLGFILILYSLVAGLLIPLGPGITKVTPTRVSAGQEVDLKITGYNTKFSKDQVEIWLRLTDAYALQPKLIEVQDRRHLVASFDIPANIPTPDTINSLNLIVSSSFQGPAVLPSAIAVLGNNRQNNIEAWKHSVSGIEGSPYMHFPFRNILAETIRNNYYHVPLWFAMMVILAISMVASVRYLQTKETRFDHRAQAFASVGTLLGILGILTGAIWARHTWGAYWSFDVKQNMAAIAVLIYLAYFILRSSVADQDVSKRIGASYNIFAFLLLVPLLFIIPRMTESLHPGSGGNPAFSSDDLDNTMRMVFYPAVVGWILFALWMGNVRQRLLITEDQIKYQ